MKTLKDIIKENIVTEASSNYERIVELANELKDCLKKDVDELKSSNSSWAKKEHNNYVSKFYDQVNFISKYYDVDKDEETEEDYK